MHLLNRIWLPSACSHLWKDKLMLVWTYSYSKKAERLYAPLEQSVAEKALLHWFGFCHLEPLLLMSSEWDSSYVCFLGQLFTDFNLIQGLLDLRSYCLNFITVDCIILLQHQLLCSEVLNHPRLNHIFAVVHCEAWHKNCLFQNVVYSFQHVIGLMVLSCY